MERFFFHLHECGTVSSDEEGREFDDLECACEVATYEARHVMAAEVQEGKLCLGCCIVIADAAQTELRRIHFRDMLAITGK